MVLPDGSTMNNSLLALDATQQPAEGGLIPCKIKGNFRLKGIRTTSPVAVGDHVTYEMNKEGFAFITKIDERRNYIIRRSSNLSKQAHILAANLDQVLLLVTVAHPETSTTFIDRFLATAEAYGVPVTLLINKMDAYTPEEKQYAENLAYLYRHIGYEVHLISVLSGEGIDAVRQSICGKTTLLSGHSGVGKSSFINLLVPEVQTRTAEISEAHDQGMHTTTFSEMYALSSVAFAHQMEDIGSNKAVFNQERESDPKDIPPTFLIDTPGIKGFGTIEFEKESVGHYFKDIFRISSECRFGNCTHTHEPGCAVLKAVEEHLISTSRYQSYLSILNDETEGKYREGE